MRTRSSTAKRLLKLITGISVMSLCAAPSLFAAFPQTDFDPQFTTQEFLTPVSQTNAWTNTIPNALASYYTYIPLSNADAVAIGFPSTCGNKTAVTNPFTGAVYHTPDSGDAASTADCYIISVRQFKQPTSLDFLKYVLPEFPIPVAFQDPLDATKGVNLFPGTGLLNAAGTPFVDTTGNVLSFAGSNGTNGTNAWGYGSGGQGWNPYYVSPANPGPTIRGCAPWAFQTTPFNFAFGPGQNGDPNATGVWHFPAPTIKGTAGATRRPVYVQWLNDLPNVIPPGHDPTVDCGANAPSCYPYNRQVVHVHGAHVGPESDGLATSWYTPNFALFGEGKFPVGAYPYTAPAGTAAAIGPINFYPLTQEAGTIWYHDHAIGTTHLNTNQGMAGFFPITDTNEIARQVEGTLPTGNNELGFALQDRHFDINAQMIMPNYAIYDKTDSNCTYLDAPGNLIPDPAHCTRQQFVKAADGHLIPLAGNQALLGNAQNPTTGCVSNPNGPYTVANQCAPFGATSASLEYFGVMPVVNGVTYGTYPVAPGVYRMRFIGGTDSRSWLMQLQTVTGAVIPFWQIASEQGLLNKPVRRDIIDLMGGERIDVLVDFNVLAVAGNVPATRVFLKNLGEDAPYAGALVTDPLTAPVPATVIPEVMVFDVSAGPVNYNSTNPATLAAAAGSPLRPAAALPALVTPDYTRTIALVEITDAFGRTMPTVDARGYRPTEVPITENILQNQIEQWDIVNTTVDAHPMHLHQVAFQLINRQAVNLFSPPDGYVVNNLGDSAYNPAFPLFPANGYIDAAAAAIYAPSQYAAVGPVIAPQAHEALAMKDTVDCPPGYVTRILTTFDILGTYVWHCHILSHEEHDMMRPFRVVAAKLAAPAYINPPATTDANGKVYVIAAATTTAPSGPAAYKYLVQFRKVGATFWHTSPTNVRNPTIDLRNLGTPETADLGPGTYEFRAQVVNQLLQDTATTNMADSNWVVSTRNSVYSNVAVAPAYLNIAKSTASTVYLIAAPSSTPGAQYEFQYNTGGGWTSFGAATATRNLTFTLPAPGTYQFQVIVTAPGFIASNPRIAAGNVVIASAAVAPAYLNLAKTFPATRTVYLIAAPSTSPGVNYVFEYSEAAAPGVWTALAASPVRNPYITLPATGTYSFRVKATGGAGGFTDSLYTNMVGTVALP